MNEKVLKKIEDGREYRSMTLEVRQVEDDSEKLVEGYATTFNEPYQLYETEDYIAQEQVDSRAFEETDMSDVIFQYDHVGRVYARLSNDTMTLDTDEHGLKVVANLGGTTEGRNLYEEISGGYTNKMSFGFTVEEDHIDEVGKENGKVVYLRTIDKVGKLYDVSAVSLPANDYTSISAKRSLEGVIEEREVERLRVVEERRKLEDRKNNLLARLNELTKGD